MCSREEFSRLRSEAKGIAKQEGRRLAILSVGFGINQLIFIRWADTHLYRNPQTAIEVPVSLLYIALVFSLVRRMDRTPRRARPVGSQCKSPVKGLSARIAAATDNCDSCGGRIILSPIPLLPDRRPHSLR